MDWPFFLLNFFDDLFHQQPVRIYLPLVAFLSKIDIFAAIYQSNQHKIPHLDNCKKRYF